MSWTDFSLVEVKPRPDGEQGIFARAALHPQTLIGVFEGKAVVIPVGADGRLKSTEYDPGKHVIQLCRVGEGVVCLADKDNLTGVDFINHSCRPNCEVQGSILVYTNSCIVPGTELLLDYRQVDLIPAGVPCWCNPPRCTI